MRKLTRRILPPALLLVSALTLPAQDLPASASDKPLEFEPQLILKEPPGPANLTLSDISATAPGDPAKLEVALQKARRKAANDERLWKQGILAKVEAERSAMKVTVLSKSLSDARLQAAQESLGALGEATPEAKAAAQEAVEKAQAECQTSLAALRKAQLDAAALNLWRQQKLQAWGSVSKQAVSRAQEQLANAKRQQESPEATLTAAPAK